ncbi:MAG: bifunctional molybdenum cofactor biosynthesis protein MoaC/MoaB [Deltaproteobacteria bacterium]|nr:bifunctional molybdenum cofactor biosynthesis protein MoaC/MoaB [Deltaproteobacteria bacterium]
MDSNFKMIDVGEKAVTRRRALACGEIRMGGVAFDLLAAGKLPKGDPLVLCEVAGVMAAKKTADWIPLCHPIPVEKARVRTELVRERTSVRVSCEVVTSAKTGVEMEALTAVSAALLTIYDLVKGTDPACEIGEIRLLEKDGGKSGAYRASAAGNRSSANGKRVAVTETETDARGEKKLRGVTAAIITVSDRCSRGEAEDRSGPLLRGLLRDAGADVRKTALVPDDKALIAEAVEKLSASAALVVLTGGTGFGPRDVTPEALEAACDRMIPGFGELLRTKGAFHTPFSFLSRATAGICGRALVIAFPGSSKAVEEGWAALAELVPHALKIAGGGNHG